MKSNKLLRVGMIGTSIAALCCFTPLLVILLAGVGFSWAVGYLDYALLPMLFGFLGITIYALWRKRQITTLDVKRSESNGNV